VSSPGQFCGVDGIGIGGFEDGSDGVRGIGVPTSGGSTDAL
jgi:hypothetical protein